MQRIDHQIMAMAIGLGTVYTNDSIVHLACTDDEDPTATILPGPSVMNRAQTLFPPPLPRFRRQSKTDLAADVR